MRKWELHNFASSPQKCLAQLLKMIRSLFPAPISDMLYEIVITVYRLMKPNVSCNFMANVVPVGKNWDVSQYRLCMEVWMCPCTEGAQTTKVIKLQMNIWEMSLNKWFPFIFIPFDFSMHSIAMLSNTLPISPLAQNDCGCTIDKFVWMTCEMGYNERPKILRLPERFFLSHFLRDWFRLSYVF